VVCDFGGVVDYLFGYDVVMLLIVGIVGFCMGGGFVLLFVVQ